MLDLSGFPCISFYTRLMGTYLNNCFSNWPSLIRIKLICGVQIMLFHASKYIYRCLSFLSNRDFFLINKRYELWLRRGGGGNKIIFSSGARFQLIDFLNVTDLNWAFLNPIGRATDLSMSQYGGIMGYSLEFTWKDCFKVKYSFVWLTKVIQLKWGHELIII